MSSRTISRQREVPFIAASVIFVFATANICGWIYDIEWLKNPLHTNFMAPNTALLLLAVALGLWIGDRSSSSAIWRILLAGLGSFVAIAGFLTLFEYITGLDIGIDRLFLRSKLYQWTAPNVFPGRIAPNTAVAFCLVGASLVWPKKQIGRFRLVECLALPVFLISFLSLMGYSFGAEALYGIASYSAMSLQTAICLCAASIGLLWNGSDTGLMSLILGDGVGGVAARRLLWALIVIFPALGWLRVRSEDTFLIDLRFGTAVLVIASVVIFGIMIIRTAMELDHLDRKRAAAEGSLVEANERLESLVEQRTSALRRLSGRLLHTQDDERRKIARELHDGLGQYLAALSINVDQLSLRPASLDGLLVDTRDTLDRAITETRTLSHLLHPPLLDEVGFHSAAKWYVEGFASRSGMEITLNLPAEMPRLAAQVEIALFRVLQEALTNIHRHSGSTRADIALTFTAGHLEMTVRDYGKGIDEERLDRWRTSNAAGVGLTSMRERISELGGDFEITNTGDGTRLQITIPLPKEPAATMDERALA